jgi:tetratricopeptide (TPR) repeat protein
MAMGCLALVLLAAAGVALVYVRTPPDAASPPSILLAPPASSTPSAPPPAPDRPPPYRGAPVGELNADPKLLDGIPQATYQRSRSELDTLAGRLDQNPRDTVSWMRVAFIKHFYSDDLGARDAYEYLNIVANDAALPFYNLATLYGYYLKEPAKAIPKYRAAIARDPVEVSYYIGFAEFYRDVMGDRDHAWGVLRTAEAKTPGSPTLWTIFAALYKGEGNTAEAIRYYEKALSSSALGPDERAAIMAEVERLKR